MKLWKGQLDKNFFHDKLSLSKYGKFDQEDTNSIMIEKFSCYWLCHSGAFPSERRSMSSFHSV